MTKELINYDTFSKLDIRVGTIVSAEVVPDADKLLRLMVDLGEEEPRQIVSGIRERVDDPNALVGTQTTFVCNLEPRTIRGLESNGMLFALGVPTETEDDAGLVLLRPESTVPAGTIAI